MREPEQPRRQTMTASEARQNWSEVLDSVLHGRVRVVIEKDGTPTAAIISAEELDRLERIEA